ncbi:hypothetical protein [Roseateles oligotrophus]|uniref:hypothetical protein n=1 Tax=Roseateles oligotrophus TaxID=1769250 RepID=UPI0021E4BB66|nr:hypothetical protein [Roseateles oligotrophus]
MALLAAAAVQAPELNAGWLLALALILAVPAVLALWHLAVVRCLLSLHQFQPGHVLHWIGSRLVLRKVFAAGFAVFAAFLSILHCASFGRRDWVLLILMPIVFVIARFSFEGLVRPQFKGAPYAAQAMLKPAGWAVVLIYILGWVGLGVMAPDAAQGGLLERVELLQAPWRHAPAASARYAADAMAWATAALDLANALSQTPDWHIALGVMTAPLATVVFASLALKGLALPVAEVRRTCSPGPSAAEVPPPITPVGAGAHAAVIVVLLLILFQFAARVEHALVGGDSPLAVRQLMDCEAIDGKVYKLGTVASITKAMTEASAKAEHAQASACAELDSAQGAAEKAVEKYLDWYFSLQAEWMRTVMMLTGSSEQMLSDQLTKTLKSAPGLAEALARAQVGSRIQASTRDALPDKVQSILGDNVLVLDERACKVVRHESIAQTLAAKERESSHLRTAGGLGVGLAAGVVVGKVAAKALTKGSMKAAAKVLAKFAAKKAASITVSTGVGMATGSVIPVVGTAAGAVVGAAVGVVISVGVEWAALAAEEHLSRDAMKTELLAAFRETLAPMRVAMACTP